VSPTACIIPRHLFAGPSRRVGRPRVVLGLGTLGPMSKHEHDFLRLPNDTARVSESPFLGFAQKPT